MLKPGIAAIREHLATLPDSAGLSVQQLRSAYDKAEKLFRLPEGLERTTFDANGVRCERLTPAGADQSSALLYFHGGGYALGSPSSHRHMVANIAAQAGISAVVPDYRLAPEAPFPAAVDDALKTYQWLLDDGVDPSSITLAGDSAGGGLTAATLVSIRDHGLPLPLAGVCISPWADMTNVAQSYETRAEADPIVTKASISRWTAAYLGDTDPRTPLASPAFADLNGLPPLLIQVGNDEVLLDDAKRLAERAESAGVATTLEVWDDMIHVWHWFAEYLDEAGEAVARIAEFIHEQKT